MLNPKKSNDYFDESNVSQRALEDADAHVAMCVAAVPLAQNDRQADTRRHFEEQSHTLLAHTNAVRLVALWVVRSVEQVRNLLFCFVFFFSHK